MCEYDEGYGAGRGPTRERVRGTGEREPGDGHHEPGDRHREPGDGQREYDEPEREPGEEGWGARVGDDSLPWRTMTTLRIPSRFNGPPGTGNGGYVAGLLADTRADAVVKVILRSPPPLEVPLRVADGGLFHGDALVAQSAPGEFDRPAPQSVSASEAASASSEYQGNELFGHCFVCGSLRPDGLRIEAGPVGDGVVAAQWTPDGTVPVGAPLLWAAMDCPGGWSVPEMFERPALLGSMTAAVQDLPEPGEECVVVGALHGEEGRKAFTATALFGSDGRLLGRAEQVWIRLAA